MLRDIGMGNVIRKRIGRKRSTPDKSTKNTDPSENTERNRLSYVILPHVSSLERTKWRENRVLG